MLKKLQKRLKNQKGFTLIELLAVIVILGIIAAIAVPSIGGIINNSKKDAHIANAKQMVSAARTAVAGNDTTIMSDNALTMKELEDNGYLESVKSPDTTQYNKDTSLVTISKSVTGTYTYTVTLVRGTTDVIPDEDPTTITRADVNLE